jgi:hypothetical protein
MRTTKTTKIIYLSLLMTIACPPAFTQTGWRIQGEAVPGGNAFLTQDPADTQTFSYVGRLSNQWFKLSDGTTNYVPLCGDSDPLGQTIDLRNETDPSETGFRIRYTKEKDFFKITLKESPSGQQITVENETPPERLYLVGGPVNTHDPNWWLDDAKELERDTENPFLFYYKGYLTYNIFGEEQGSIKFLTGLTWDPAYHPDGTSNHALLQALKTPAKMRLNGADTKWTIPANKTANGYYEISLNTLDNTICVDSFRHSTEAYPEKIFIAGPAMPCHWVNDYPEAMTPVAGQYGVYRWSGITTQGAFKFLQARGTWGRCYVAATADEQVVFDQPHPIIYEFEYYNNGGNDYKFVMPKACLCTITVDLKEMRMTVQNNGETALPAPATAPGDAIAIRYDRQSRLLYIDAKTGDAPSALVSIFTMNGTVVAQRKLGNGFSISLPAGIYGVSAANAKIVYRKKIVIY